MANEQHLKILQQGAHTWNEWRIDNPSTIPDLCGADLHGFDFYDTNLTGAKLCGAVLRETRLGNLANKVNFRMADLTRADLHNIRMHEATFIAANLDYANLSDSLFSQCNFRRATLNYAKLLRGNFHGANFRQSELQSTDLRGADLRETLFVNADLTGANLFGTNLERALLIEANFERAILKNCRVHGVSVWSLIGEPEDATNLIITPEGEPSILVNDLEVAQFIHLLLNHKKLRNALESLMERGVLLLGRFSSGGIELLNALADKLRELRYLPIIFDFDRPSGRTYRETVKTLVGLSRFVVVDLSGPSVPAELEASVPHFKIPFVPILQKGVHHYSMFTDLLENDWVIKPIIEFQDEKHLLELVPSKIVGPAEERAAERQSKLAILLSGE